jgi:hypothetical protein
MMIEQGHGDSMHDTVSMIARLATATASDRRTVKTLTATNAKLASQLEAAQTYIKMRKDEMLALKENIKPAWQGQRPAKSTNNNTSDSQGPHERHLQSEKGRTPVDGNKRPHHGRHRLGKIMMRRGN